MWLSVHGNGKNGNLSPDGLINNQDRFGGTTKDDEEGEMKETCNYVQSMKSLNMKKGFLPITLYTVYVQV